MRISCSIGALSYAGAMLDLAGVCGSAVQVEEQGLLQPLCSIPPREVVQVVLQQEHQICLCLPLHL